MPKVFTPRLVIRMLRSHGFLFKRAKGSHHIFQHPQTRRRVVVPVHHKDIPKGTLHSILEQAGLSAGDIFKK